MALANNLFISWGEYTSHNSRTPDLLYLRVLEPKLYSTAISINAKVDHKGSDRKWHQKNLPIKYHTSKNYDFLKQWVKLERKKKIRKGTRIVIKTWLDTSKRNRDRTIRRFKILVSKLGRGKSK
ncbi:MAG: hypothetical protein ABI342_07180 [Nitrososphaera sp.]|jgi:hypothetical protein